MQWEYIITSHFYDILPKMHYQNWIIRKHQTNPNRGPFFKITAGNLQKFQGHECQCKTVELFQIGGNERLITECDTLPWIE